MSEKKKVQVVVDSSGSQSGASNPGGQGFDFSSFQQQFYDDDSGNTSRGSREERGEDSAFLTSYQARKTSIVEGMTSEALVDEHRKSVAAFATKELGKQVHQSDMGGITLSKRHGLTKIEYEAELDGAAYNEMHNFAFGDGLESH